MKLAKQLTYSKSQQKIYNDLRLTLLHKGAYNPDFYNLK